jgi:hypothetical protein
LFLALEYECAFGFGDKRIFNEFIKQFQGAAKLPAHHEQADPPIETLALLS